MVMFDSMTKVTRCLYRLHFRTCFLLCHISASFSFISRGTYKLLLIFNPNNTKAQMLNFWDWGWALCKAYFVLLQRESKKFVYM